MKVFKIKECRNCTEEYYPSGPASKFCLPCGIQKKIDCRVREKEKKNTGVGSGNSPTNRGTTHPMYKNGIGMYKKIRDWKFIIIQDGRCAHCNKQADLLDFNPHEWCGHHIDHDRTNNNENNIEVVCKSCHQKEHEVWKNFKKGATTISKESTLK